MRALLASLAILGLVLVLVGWTLRHKPAECIAWRLHLGPAWACAIRIAASGKADVSP